MLVQKSPKPIYFLKTDSFHQNRFISSQPLHFITTVSFHHNRFISWKCSFWRVRDCDPKPKAWILITYRLSDAVTSSLYPCWSKSYITLNFQGHATEQYIIRYVEYNWPECQTRISDHRNFLVISGQIQVNVFQDQWSTRQSGDGN